MIEIKDYLIFTENMASLKELSKSGGDKGSIRYMTDSRAEAVDFKGVKNQYISELGLFEESVSALDGLISIPGGFAFVQFDNEHVRNEKNKLQDRIRDSLLIFCDITGKSISYTRRMVDLIFVHDMEEKYSEKRRIRSGVQESPSRAEIGRHFLGKGGEKFVQFGLGRFKKMYFRKVYEFSKGEFENFISIKIR